MQAEKLNYNAKSIFAGNLYKNYRWFYANFFEKINAASLDFFNSDLGLKFISVSEKDNVLFAGEDYFVTKIRISKDFNVLFRISSTAVESILSDVFGPTETPFEFEDLTELEAKIITSFNDFLFKHISENLVDVSNIGKKVKNTNDCHLTFFVKTQGSELGKLIVSIPIVALPEIPAPELVYNFSIDNFPKTKVAVGLEVGKTRSTLHEVKSIGVGDIVVLEKSNLNKMVLITDGQRKPFKLSPDPSLIVTMDDAQDDEQANGGQTMEDNVSQNMWDSIQVDISAEFEQVKIPLGDLRQISEGLVVDIGSVYENKIDLKVENKVIASGELVIINDRYGVRVDSIYNAGDSAPEVKQEEIAQDVAAEGTDAEFNEDDFDYSNFEIEDENI